MQIIRDTRERNGWDFPFSGNENIISKKLDAGDYTTELLEDFVVVERKATATEIANNLGKKDAKARFYREFDRMKNLHKAYIVCEFPESNVYEFPKKSELHINIQKIKSSINLLNESIDAMISLKESDVKNLTTLNKLLASVSIKESSLKQLEDKYKSIRMNGGYLRKLIGQIEQDYNNIEVVFCNNRDEAENFTYDILEFWESEIRS